MPVTNNDIIRLLKCIDLEEKEQSQRYRLDQHHTLKAMKAEGLALHPLTVTRKSFGYSDYPEISFRLNFPAETTLFRDGAAIECFFETEAPVKGMLLNLNGKSGEMRLIAPDFPDWIEDAGIGIKLAPDQHTTTVMKTALNKLEANKPLYHLFQQLHNHFPQQPLQKKNVAHPFENEHLNISQQEAVQAIIQNEELVIVHGPPGTGKTTTLAEAIIQLVEAGEKVLVTAPSNTAVDNIAIRLINLNVPVLRIGNTGKVHEMVLPHTPEGRLVNSKQQKEIRQLKIQAEDYRKMALKYKRNFGKAEKEQRDLLFKEVKNIRTEIKKLQSYNEHKLYAEAAVILGTPVGLYDAGMHGFKFQTLFIDEAGQCIEPLAWSIFPLAKKYVLAGDHFQLPPTVLSQEAMQLGLNKSILEIAINTSENIFLLDMQYRMRKAIAGFSGSYFYNDRLQTAATLQNTGIHVTFIDTAGSGYYEAQGSNGMSLQNEGELAIVQRLIESEGIEPLHAAFISPYNGQVTAARELLPPTMRTSTIDGFQGQEKEIIIVSLVRSNDENDIGFLKDYRRMNVAVTRAKEKLFVIGDSATIGADKFYKAFIDYVEINGNYRSVWEFML